MDQGNRRTGIAYATVETVGVNHAVENRSQKQQTGVCVRKRCGAPAADGSDYCARHAEHQRQYNASYMARRRAERLRKKLCTFCGARLARRDWPSPGDRTASCPACRIKRDRMKTAGVKSSVENRTERIAARVEEVLDATDGYARKRFRGGKRGAPKAEQLDEADLRDLRLYVEKAAAGLALANSDEVQALPRIQRDEAKHAAMSWVALLVRAGLVFMKRKGIPLPSHADHLVAGEMIESGGKTGR